MKANTFKVVFGTVCLIAGSITILLHRNPAQSTAHIQKKVNTTQQRLLSNDVPTKENVSGSYEQKRKRLIRSIDAQPFNGGEYATLARLLMDGHRYREAIRYFEQGIVLQPSNDSLLLDISVCYFNERRYDKAMASTDLILSRTPHHPRALYNKAAILATVKNVTAAVRTWKQLITAHPESAEAHEARIHLAQMVR